jgi:Mg-chelatase subunit ChlD
LPGIIIGRRTSAVGRASAVFVALLACAFTASVASAQEGYGLKIFRVQSGLYPFVQVYFRTFNSDMEPLVNLNELNIGIMVKGRTYDLSKGQYRIASIRDRNEAVRTVLVIDSSGAMAGPACDEARKAAARYIDSKRPQDQVAILAMSDGKDGHDVISNFERDAGALGRRLADVKCDTKASRLYDTIGAALKMSGMVSQGKSAGGETDYIVSNSIVVMSDGKDDGSAITRDDLSTRISSLEIPIPIYAIAASQDSTNFKNLEALSKNSFGKYYVVGETLSRMQKVIEGIQNIQLSDYVVMIRSYVPVDGEEHPMKLGVEYPSRSGKMTYEASKFEALEAPPIPAVKEKLEALSKLIPALPDNNPYLGGTPAAAK